MIVTSPSSIDANCVPCALKGVKEVCVGSLLVDLPAFMGVFRCRRMTRGRRDGNTAVRRLSHLAYRNLLLSSSHMKWRHTPQNTLLNLSSVGTATGWPAGLRFFSSPQRPYRLCDPPSLLSSGHRGLFPLGLKLTTHLHLVPRSRMVELYLHSLICFHGIVLN
jgi:hypothetical protein